MKDHAAGAALRTSASPVRSGRGRGRPPDIDLEQRTYDMCLDVYARSGWAGLTIDAVAREARVGKASIYSRWSNKQDLLVTALSTIRAHHTVHDDAPLRSELLRVGLVIADRYLGRHGMAYLRAQVEAKIYPDVLGQAMEVLRHATIASGRRIILRAIDRREIPATVSPAIVMDALAGTIVHHILMLPAAGVDRLAKSPLAYVEQVVEFILAGVSAHPAHANTPVGKD